MPRTTDVIMPSWGTRTFIVLTLAGLSAAYGEPASIASELDRERVDRVLVMAEEPAADALVLDEGTELFRLGDSNDAGTRSFSQPPRGVILHNGDVVVNDVWSSEIRRYDPEGTLVWVAGREGEGPGEFRGLDWVGLSPDGTIAAWNASDAQLSFFDEVGRFLVRRLADTLSMGPGSDRYLFEQDGSRVLITPLLGGEPLEAMSGDLLFLGHSSAPYLFGVTAQGDTVVRLGIELRRTATALLADRVAELRAARLATIPDHAPAPFREAWESAPVAEALPLWTRLIGSSDGSLWLGLFDTRIPG